MASLDSKGEIAPVELPNPEETQLRKGENELVCLYLPTFSEM